MAEKKIIDVQVKESGVDELNDKLERTEKNLRDVDRQAGRTSQELKEVGENGGVISILDTVTGGLASGMRDAAEATGLMNLKLKGFRGALIATGIGALVVALGTVVAYWDDIVAYITDANEELEEQERIIKRINALQDRVDFNFAIQERMLMNDENAARRRAELAGATEEELTRIQEEGLRNRLKFFQRYVDNYRAIMNQAGASEEQVKAAAEAEARLLLRIAETQDQLAQLQHERRMNRRDRNDQQVDTDMIGPVTGMPLSILKQNIDIEADLLNSARQSDIQNAQVQADVKMRLAQEEAEFKMALAQETANTLAALSVLAGQQTGVGKALGIAAATINTAQAVTKALSQGGIFGVAQAVAIGAMGLAQIRQILQVDVPDARLDSPLITNRGGSPQAPQVQAPNFNIVGDPGINQLNETIRQRENQPLRAYVVQDDIRTGEELDRRVRSQASLG